MEKNSELRSKGYWDSASFKRMVWEGVSEKAASDQGLEGSAGVSSGDIRQKSVPGRRNSKGKGSEAGRSAHDCRRDLGELHREVSTSHQSPSCVHFTDEKLGPAPFAQDHTAVSGSAARHAGVGHHS